MDKEQEEMQFLGLFGVIRETFHVLHSWRKIFSQITLAVILPLSFIFLAQVEISQLLFSKILRNEERLDLSGKHSTLSDVISSEWRALWVFRIVYFIFFLVLYLVSTSAVVYTIASVYTSRDVSFRKIMSVVPKVWKRLFITFLWSFHLVFTYNILFIGVSAMLMMIAGQNPAILGGCFVTYLMGFAYIGVVWHLASVISVLEDGYGIEAMRKGRALISGKLGTAIVVFILLTLALFSIQLVFETQVVAGNSVEGVVGYGVGCLVSMGMVILVSLVVQTVIYFVCKSYHHENIDKYVLGDHLQEYEYDYVPLKSMDVQLRQISV